MTSYLKSEIIIQKLSFPAQSLSKTSTPTFVYWPPFFVVRGSGVAVACERAVYTAHAQYIPPLSVNVTCFIEERRLTRKFYLFESRLI